MKSESNADRIIRPYKIIKCAIIVFVLCCFSLQGCSHKVPHPGKGGKKTGTARAYTIAGSTYYPLPSSSGFRQTGYASWYGPGFHGRKTASGECYDMHAMTAAHRILPMDTWVRVRNLDNNREVVVRINDRGPFVRNRIIDLSYSAASRLGVVGPGTARVEITALGESRVKGDRASGFRRHPDLVKGNFYVQVGAFRNAANAYALRDKLRTRYKKVMVRQYESGNGLFYRVHVFAAHDYDAARRAGAMFEQNGFPRAFVVRW